MSDPTILKLQKALDKAENMTDQEYLELLEECKDRQNITVNIGDYDKYIKGKITNEN